MVRVSQSDPEVPRARPPEQLTLTIPGQHCTTHNTRVTGQRVCCVWGTCECDPPCVMVDLTHEEYDRADKSD